MTDDRSLGRAARSWIETGPTQAPDHAVEAALARIQSTRQERGPWIPWRLPTMNPIVSRLAGLTAVLAVVIAGAVLIRPGPEAGTGASPAPSLASPSPSPSAPAILSACGLVTATEAEQLVGNVGTGAQPSESGTGTETTCIYLDGGGNIVLRLTYTKTGGLAAFDAVRTAFAEAVPVDGIKGADAAVFDPSTSTLYVLKGDGLVKIFAGAFGQPTDRRQGIETAVGEVAVGRMLATP